MAGGSRKGVYRLTMDDNATAIAYLWTGEENYWPGETFDRADPFTAQAGLDMFLAAHARLASLGLRVPRLYHVEGPVAVVEDFPGGSLQNRFDADPREMAPTMRELAEALTAMRGFRAPAFGTVAHVDAGGRSRWESCEKGAFAYGQSCLAEAAARDDRIAGAQERLNERLNDLHARIRPRQEFCVVHGELGLDHVLVDAEGRPVLIDIEDLAYSDVEWEHVFLRIRLQDDYRWSAVSGLDEDRLALYMLVQRLSLVAGPLRLLEGYFPDRVFMRSIAEHNLGAALRLI